MPGNHPRPPDGPSAAPDAPPNAALILQGLAARLAVPLKAFADQVLSELAPPPGGVVDTRELEPVTRKLGAIARAASGLHRLQADEDRADQRAEAQQARRASAAIYAGRPRAPSNDEGETEMNEPDPRLNDPDAMAEVYQEIDRRVARLVRLVETKRTPAAPDAGADAGGAGPPLDRQGPPGPAAA